MFDDPMLRFQSAPNPVRVISEYDPDARFLEIYLTVDDCVRKSNPVEVRGACGASGTPCVAICPPRPYPPLA